MTRLILNDGKMKMTELVKPKEDQGNPLNGGTKEVHPFRVNDVSTWTGPLIQALNFSAEQGAAYIKCMSSVTAQINAVHDETMDELQASTARLNYAVLRLVGVLMTHTVNSMFGLASFEDLFMYARISRKEVGLLAHSVIVLASERYVQSDTEGQEKLRSGIDEKFGVVLDFRRISRQALHQAVETLQVSNGVPRVEGSETDEVSGRHGHPARPVILRAVSQGGLAPDVGGTNEA